MISMGDRAVMTRDYYAIRTVLLTSRNSFSRSRPCSAQFRLHRDFGIQQFRDRAAALGVCGGGLELLLRRARHAGLDDEVNLFDRKTLRLLFERDGCGGVVFIGGQAGVAELSRQRHRETAGMRGGDQLFRVGADATL